jgi:hypothetical protein
VKAEEGKVLIHDIDCTELAPAFMTAYMLIAAFEAHKKLPLKDALAHVQKLHKATEPNDGFISKLIALEKKLYGCVCFSAVLSSNPRIFQFEELVQFCFSSINLSRVIIRSGLHGAGPQRWPQEDWQSSAALLGSRKGSQAGKQKRPARWTQVSSFFCGSCIIRTPFLHLINLYAIKTNVYRVSFCLS